jgi:hypothetical protein
MAMTAGLTPRTLQQLLQNASRFSKYCYVTFEFREGFTTEVLGVRKFAYFA